LLIGIGMRLLDRMTAQPSLQGKIKRRINPDPSVDLSDLETAVEWSRKICLGQYHPIGTRAMGDVVDSKLKVKGVESLRVCDASVFPNHVSGNIGGIVNAVAEKGADLIKADN
jgi:choline dehydrogenase-like flavoprotein